MQYYGVWVGRNPGVYESWDECKSQTDKFKGAKFKKLNATTKEAALIEFAQGHNVVTNPQPSVAKSISNDLQSAKQVSAVRKTGIIPVQTSPTSNKPLDGFLTVDGASNGENCEYQGVFLGESTPIIKSKVFDGGTNNIGEFLGLVHAIHFLRKNNKPIRIYSDSVTAMAWVRDGKANTTAHLTGKATLELSELIAKSEKYLQDNAHLLQDAIISKWDTKSWGEIPADFGRK